MLPTNAAHQMMTADNTIRNREKSEHSTANYNTNSYGEKTKLHWIYLPKNYTRQIKQFDFDTVDGTKIRDRPKS